MIASFSDKDTEMLARGYRSKGFQPFEKIARRKLRQLEIAATIEDLKFPPGNKLEPLKGDRKGAHSIRINDQYRICFRWNGADAEDVEMVDCH